MSETELTATELTSRRDAVVAELAKVNEELPAAARIALLSGDAVQHTALKTRKADLENERSLIDDALPALQRQEASDRATIKEQVLAELDQLLVETERAYAQAQAACEVSPLNDRAKCEAYFWSWRRLIALHQDIAILRYNDAARIPRWLIYWPAPVTETDITVISDLRKAKPPLDKPWQPLLDRLNS
ncbi:MAG TPA: hypothetical protein VKU87_00095 [Thermomicrobiaceae bacterium]|nr:hypothetical protein [Thermomicrobiaceae bacterium]